jgi:hypothetical protein
MRQRVDACLSWSLPPPMRRYRCPWRQLRFRRKRKTNNDDGAGGQESAAAAISRCATPYGVDTVTSIQSTLHTPPLRVVGDGQCCRLDAPPKGAREQGAVRRSTEPTLERRHIVPGGDTLPPHLLSPSPSPLRLCPLPLSLSRGCCCCCCVGLLPFRPAEQRQNRKKDRRKDAGRERQTTPHRGARGGGAGGAVGATSFATSRTAPGGREDHCKLAPVFCDWGERPASVTHAHPSCSHLSVEL